MSVSWEGGPAGDGPAGDGPVWDGLDGLPAQARQRWAAARVWAARQAPYLATAVLALDPVVVTARGGPPGDLRGFPVDPAWRIYIDPDILAAADVPTVGFWLLHQVAHLLRDHADRAPESVSGVAPTGAPGRPTTAQGRWNTATDAEINDDLCAGEVVIPIEAVTPAGLGLPEGWLAEQYWDALGGAPPADGVSLGSPIDPPSQGGGSTAVGADPTAPVDCGSGCDDRPRRWDASGPGLGALDRQLLGRDVARRIREHQQTRGNLPAGWRRFADDVLDPVVDWRRHLAAAVRRGVADIAGRVDFTYRRPSRRAAAVPNVVLPSLRQPMPRVAVVIDTSGSMDDGRLMQALGEVSGVLRGLGTGRRDLRVICCDAAPHAIQRVVDARDIRLLGGGGTDMGAGLRAAAELRPRPDFVVVLTDGHTPWPERAPGGVRVVVGLMDRTGRTPPWATTVLIGPADFRSTGIGPGRPAGAS